MLAKESISCRHLLRICRGCLSFPHHDKCHNEVIMLLHVNFPASIITLEHSHLHKTDTWFIVSPEIWARAQHFLRDYMCAQRRFRSACTSAQADQSLRCPFEEALNPWLPLECPARTLIKLCRCAGWSECSLGAQWCSFVGTTVPRLACQSFHFCRLVVLYEWTRYRQFLTCHTSV